MDLRFRSPVASESRAPTIISKSEGINPFYGQMPDKYAGEGNQYNENCKPGQQDIIGFKPEDPFNKDDLVGRCKQLCYHTGCCCTKHTKTRDEYKIQQKIDKYGYCSHCVQLL